MIPKRPRGEGPGCHRSGLSQIDGMGKNSRPWKEYSTAELARRPAASHICDVQLSGSHINKYKETGEIPFGGMVYLHYYVRNITPATGSQCEPYETYLLFSHLMSLKSRV